MPYKALREALINSLCHRQWEKYNLTNSIAIYDDRVEIANPGIFPSQITSESIKEPHESYPYNLKIAEALYKSTYLESWGSGAKRIMDACREQGVEEPSWRWDGGFVTVTFERPNKKASEAISEDTPLNHRSTIVQVPSKFRPSSVQVQKVILSMNDGYMTMNEIMANVGLKHRTSFRENYFIPALADGAIELLYPDQPNHPKQQYRLAEVAKEWKSGHR